MTRFYITTPIYYVNGPPHLGHAYATIAADSLARFHRARGADAYFVTGTDEHGQKIEEAAAEQGVPPAELAASVVDRFRATWQNLDIANDDFIRTTEDRHKRVVRALWQRIADAGDIYLGAYEGHYCVACEGFYTDNQLDPGNRCPTHKTEVKWLSEPSYFFRMSNYADRLLQHFDENPDFVRPENYKNEIVAFIKRGLRDLSVSRTTFQWGIPVPGDDGHVIYVWIDALTNYVSALGGPGGALFEKFWPATCHLIGKDILRFHAVYWPCMLLSAGLPLPETIFTTGWWTVRKEKISKSSPATRVDPNLLAEGIGVDVLRYFLLREVPLGLDGDFAYDALIGRYNADLANDFGNLLNRTLTMTGKFCAGKIPAGDEALAAQAPHADLAQTAREAIESSAALLADYAPSRALEAMWTLVRAANRYIDTCQPWKLAKRDTDEARVELGHVMRTALEALACAARMVAPVMPGKAAELLGQIGLDDAARAQALSAWPDPAKFGATLPTGIAIQRGDVLFPRIDKDRAAALIATWMPDAEAPAAPDKQAPKTPESRDKAGVEPIEFSDFTRIDLRVAEIKAAEPVPKTSKLLHIQVDLGHGDVRQVVAGIAEAYECADLIGKKVIFVANLKPAKIRGVTSEGMILAAGDKSILGLSAIDADVPPGTKVR